MTFAISVTETASSTSRITGAFEAIYFDDALAITIQPAKYVDPDVRLAEIALAEPGGITLAALRAKYDV